MKDRSEKKKLGERRPIVLVVDEHCERRAAIAEVAWAARCSVAESHAVQHALALLTEGLTPDVIVLSTELAESERLLRARGTRPVIVLEEIAGGAALIDPARLAAKLHECVASLHPN